VKQDLVKAKARGWVRRRTCAVSAERAARTTAALARVSAHQRGGRWEWVVWGEGVGV